MPTVDETMSHAAIQTLPRIALALEKQNAIAIHSAQMEHKRFSYAQSPMVGRFPVCCDQDACPVCGGKDAR